MGVSRMTGTPWHMERYTRDEGDERRHRSRCVYYRKSDAYYSEYIGKCRGAAHCTHYSEFVPEEQVLARYEGEYMQQYEWALLRVGAVNKDLGRDF